MKLSKVLCISALGFLMCGCTQTPEPELIQEEEENTEMYISQYNGKLYYLEEEDGVYTVKDEDGNIVCDRLTHKAEKDGLTTFTHEGYKEDLDYILGVTKENQVKD